MDGRKIEEGAYVHGQIFIIDLMTNHAATGLMFLMLNLFLLHLTAMTLVFIMAIAKGNHLSTASALVLLAMPTAWIRHAMQSYGRLL